MEQFAILHDLPEIGQVLVRRAYEPETETNEVSFEWHSKDAKAMLKVKLSFDPETDEGVDDYNRCFWGFADADKITKYIVSFGV